MAISPMSYSVGWLRGLHEARADMVDLQRQLTTGKKADLYSGLGGAGTIDTAVLMRSRIDSLDAFQSSSALLANRMDTIETALGRYSSLTREMRTAVAGTNAQAELPSPVTLQSQAKAAFEEAVSLLNTDIGGRYLFSGREVTQEPVAKANAILEGDGLKAGFRQVAHERLLADLGVTDPSDVSTGRLDIDPLPDGVQVSSDGSAYGFKIASVTAANKLGGDVTASTLTTTPDGSGGVSDFTVAVDGAVPGSGDTLTITLTLPDNTTTTLKLKAVASPPVINETDSDAVRAQKLKLLNDINATDEPGVVRFEIAMDDDLVVDVATTIQNLQNSLGSGLDEVAKTELSSASAFAAADDFFDHPAQRVDWTTDPLQPRDATADDTVQWYRGDRSDNPRGASTASVADGLTVSYGAEADEASLKASLKNFAVMAVAEYKMPDEAEAYAAKARRLVPNLQQAATSIGEVRADVAWQRVVVEKAGDRNKLEKATAENLLGSVENADINEVAVSLLQLQTQLQGSYQVTAMLSRLSLVNLL